MAKNSLPNMDYNTAPVSRNSPDKSPVSFASNDMPILIYINEKTEKQKYRLKNKYLKV
jgi:hypothetical protein